MSLKLKALLILAGFVVGTVAITGLVQYIAINASVESIKTAISVSVIGGLLYSVYGLILSKLEHDKKMDEISANINKITSK